MTQSNYSKQLRKEKRITIVELASRMGVSQGYLARLEMGEVEATEEQVETIRMFLNEER